MKFIGSLLVLYGLAAIVLTLLAMNIVGFDWMTMWGEQIAWGIRGGFVVLGLIFFLLSSGGAKSAA